MLSPQMPLQVVCSPEWLGLPFAAVNWAPILWWQMHFLLVLLEVSRQVCTIIAVVVFTDLVANVLLGVSAVEIGQHRWCFSKMRSTYFSSYCFWNLCWQVGQMNDCGSCDGNAIESLVVFEWVFANGPWSSVDNAWFNNLGSKNWLDCVWVVLCSIVL